MNRVWAIVSLVVALSISLVYCDVTPAVQCPDLEFDNLLQRVEVLPCGPKGCKLRKGTNITVNFNFKPDHKVKSLTNRVSAILVGTLQLPFIGVDGTSVCDRVTRADSGAAAPCPLEPGTEYKVTTIVPVEPYYPSAKLTVHWSLDSQEGSVICFRVPARIVDGKPTRGS